MRTGFIALLLALILPVHAKYFHYQAVIQSSEIKPVWIASADQHPAVVPFSNLELGFSLPAFAEKAVADFIQTGTGLNPFDPDKVDARVIFSNGKETYTAYGFYYEEYIRDSSTIQAIVENCPTARWIKTETASKWRARFCPPSLGKWSVVVQVLLPAISNIPYVSDSIHFTCYDEGARQRYLEVGSDKRHFRLYKSASSFFPIGQDIAWPDGQRFRGGANPAYPNLVAGGYLDIQDWITNLSRNGGNMIRVVTVPWSYEFEWEAMGNYSSGMGRAWELDRLFEVCEQQQVKMMFCMEHGTYTIPAWNEEHLDWKKHPYHLGIPAVKMPDDFLTDSTSRAMYKKKLRYFFARWGYSTSLGIFELLSEMDLWTLTKSDPSRSDLAGNSEAQEKLLNWHTEMLSYAKAQVAYRPLLTSSCYGGPPRDYGKTVFNSPAIDVVCPRHCYFTERNDNLRRWEEVNFTTPFEKGIHGMYPDKPAFIDEMGFGYMVADPNDMDGCNDITFHNAIWATSFMGTSGSGLYWWRWSSNAYRQANFPALAMFFSGVNFEQHRFVLPGHWEDARRTSNVEIETFYIATDDSRRTMCMGWVHNASYWWGNVSRDCKDRNGKTTLINSRTGDDADVPAPRELSAGKRFHITNLANGADYKLRWYSTRGEGGADSVEQVRTSVFGTAKPRWIPGAADWAYKMQLIGKVSTADYTLMVLPNDTLNAGEETVQAFGNHPLDSNGTFTYHWDFGNGIISNDKNATVIFQPGTFVVTLTCRDASGNPFAMSQSICVRGDDVAAAAAATKFHQARLAF